MLGRKGKKKKSIATRTELQGYGRKSLRQRGQGSPRGSPLIRPTCVGTRRQDAQERPRARGASRGVFLTTEEHEKSVAGSSSPLCTQWRRPCWGLGHTSEARWPPGKTWKCTGPTHLGPVLPVSATCSCCPFDPD